MTCAGECVAWAHVWGRVRKQVCQLRNRRAHLPSSVLAPVPCRLFILYGDWRKVKALAARAQVLCEDGGDWERKNKLKVGRERGSGLG